MRKRSGPGEEEVNENRPNRSSRRTPRRINPALEGMKRKDEPKTERKQEERWREARDSRLGAGRINKRSAPPSHLEHLYFAAIWDASHPTFLTIDATKKKRRTATEGQGEEKIKRGRRTTFFTFRYQLWLLVINLFQRWYRRSVTRACTAHRRP